MKIKAFTSLFLVFIFFSGMIYQTYALIDFYLNQEQIEKEFCINKSKPELNCHGTCHLKEKIAITIPTENENTMLIESSMFMLYFFSKAEVLYSNPFLIQGKKEIIFSPHLDLLNVFLETFVPPPNFI